MTFPLLEAEDLIRIIETDTIQSCPYEATRSILALLAFAVDRESHRTPLSLSVGPIARPTTLTREEVLSVLKFIVVKRLELTYATTSLDVKWGRLATWCQDTLSVLLPRLFPEEHLISKET